jgi:transposase
MKQYRIDSLDEQILQSIPGIGPIIASAFSSTIDKGQAFKHSKDFAVWLGLTPKQVASGNKSIMLGISKRGNNYLRKQLIHGARSIVKHAVVNQDKDALRGWIYQLRTRKSFNCTVVATARKLAQLIWLLLQKQEQYRGHCINTHFKSLR